METMGQRGQHNGRGGGTEARNSVAVTETTTMIDADSADLIVRQTAAERPASSTGAAAEPCTACGSEQSAIRINVDGNTLLMESCDECDVRRWQLEGERIDLQEALNQVGEHSGRRRSRS